MHPDNVPGFYRAKSLYKDLAAKHWHNLLYLMKKTDDKECERFRKISANLAYLHFFS
jgi:hypothetical protein